MRRRDKAVPPRRERHRDGSAPCGRRVIPGFASFNRVIGVLGDERQRLLWTLVGRLEERCQQLLRVVAFAPPTNYATVAAALGMPIGSIGPTRGRCLAKLRAMLAAEPAWSWS